MDDLIFALNAILPITILIFLGYLLRKINLVSKSVFEGLNKLCFYVFLPLMLFKGIYDTSSIADIDGRLVLFILVVSLVIFTIGAILVKLLVKDDKKKGVILQGVFRANYAIIGISLAEAIAGSEGVMIASLVSLVTIPLYNLLGTVALTMFIKGEDKKSHFKHSLKKIVTNPLIIGVCLGILVLVVRFIFEANSIAFRLSDIVVLDKTLSSLSKITTPLALITLGGLFEFKAMKGMQKEIIITVLSRLVLIPVSVFLITYFFFDYSSAEYSVLIACFASPIAVASAVMAKEMDNDETLANQIVVWSVVCSIITIFGFVYVFRLLGIL